MVMIILNKKIFQMRSSFDSDPASNGDTDCADVRVQVEFYPLSNIYVINIVNNWNSTINALWNKMKQNQVSSVFISTALAVLFTLVDSGIVLCMYV